ncbi:MAG TPA: cytochrome P450 [Trebonia sp.]|jgi:cytochrome P450
MAEQIPAFDFDPFSDESLTDPYGYYRTLRDAGPVFSLPRYDVLGIARFDDVRAGLKDWQHFSSTEGPGFNARHNEKMRGTVVASDPPEHDVARTVMIKRLRLGRLREVEPLADKIAAELLDDCLGRDSFDAASDLARPFVTRFTGAVLGVPLPVLDQCVEGSVAGFNNVGPLNERAVAAGPVIEQAFEVMHSLTKADMTPGSIGWDVLDAHDRGEIPKLSSFTLLFNFLGPAFDTTINAIGSIVWLLAGHPGQWQALRASPGLVPAAVNEGLRIESPLQIWSRTARGDLSVDGVTVPSGRRIAVFLGAANRDERHYQRPDDFEITRNPVDHLSFGNGLHMCVGAPLARLEISSVLRALLDRVRTLEPAGQPVLRLNNTTRGFASAPVRAG